MTCNGWSKPLAYTSFTKPDGGAAWVVDGEQSTRKKVQTIIAISTQDFWRPNWSVS